jgi:hypothetical protein
MSQQQYNVEAIVSHRLQTNYGKWQSFKLMVKWDGYPSDENTEEPLSNMLNDVGDTVRRYFAEKGLKVVKHDTIEY